MESQIEGLFILFIYGVFIMVLTLCLKLLPKDEKTKIFMSRMLIYTSVCVVILALAILYFVF